MKAKYLIGLVSVLIIAAMTLSSCRSYNRTRTVNFWDRNVTTVKKPKRSGVKMRRKAVTSRHYNRAHRLPGR